MNFRKRFFLVLVSIFIILGIASCVKAADTVTISLEQESYTVHEGETLKINVKIEAGSNLDVNDIKRELTYSSSDEEVATFVNGELTGVGYGNTEIKVEWNQKTVVFDKAKVKVLLAGLPDVHFGNYNPNMLKGQSQTVAYSFVPDYTDATVEWESLNPEVATVDQNGKITAVAVGEASIVCYAVSGTEKKPNILKINVSESDFAVNYVLDNGTNSEQNPAGYNSLETPIQLAPATKTGYEFKGWFADAEFTQEFNAIPEGSTGDVTVYAKFEAVQYTITYDLAGGTNAQSNPATFTVEDEVVFAPATLDGSKFVKWVDATTGEEVTKIAKGTLANVSIKAVFEADAFKVVYNLDGGKFVLPYKYQSHAELAVDFINDFNTFASRDAAIVVQNGEVVSTTFFDRSWFGSGSKGYEFVTDAKYADKWSWVLELINENRVARGADVLNADSPQAEARGDMHNFLGLTNPQGPGSNASFGGDYTSYKFEEYAAKYLEKVPTVKVEPYEFSPSEGAIVPDPIKAEHTFVGWGEEVTSIHTSANSNFWTVYATEIFLFKANANANPQFSFRVGLGMNADGTYTVIDMPKDGDATAAKGDLILTISDSYGDLASVADFKSKVQLGQTVIVEGSTKTGVADVHFYNLKDREVAATVTTTANTGFFQTYENDIFLGKGDSLKATFAYKVGFSKNEAGVYEVVEIGTDDTYTYASEYTILVSNDYADLASLADFTGKVALGNLVKVDGDLSTGKATFTFINNYTTIPAGTQGDQTFNAVFAEIKDENGLEFVAEGAEVSGAVNEYLTSTGLDLAEITASKAGYTFKGWSESAGGSIITSIPAGTRGDLSLYAVFEAIEYTITYELGEGSWSRIDIVNAYDSFDALVADFLADYSAKYGVTGLTASNFFTKSSSFGLLAMFEKDETLSAKWAWLKNFIINFNSSYSGLSYLKNTSNASNYNKYWRANVAAFLQQTKLSSPATNNYANTINEEFWVNNGLKKDKSVIIEPKVTYTADELPLTLQIPMRDGHTLVGFADNEFYKNPYSAIPAGQLGDIKLYAVWDDTKEIVKMTKINYVFGEEGQNVDSPVEYEEGKGIALGTASRPGYSFVGFTTDEAGEQPIAAIDRFARGEVTVYAQWEVVTYDLEYETGEGAFTTYEDGITVLGAKAAELAVKHYGKSWSGTATEPYLAAVVNGNVGGNSCMYQNFYALKYNAALNAYEIIGSNAKAGKGISTFDGATHILSGLTEVSEENIGSYFVCNKAEEELDDGTGKTEVEFTLTQYAVGDSFELVKVGAWWSNKGGVAYLGAVDGGQVSGNKCTWQRYLALSYNPTLEAFVVIGSNTGGKAIDTFPRATHVISGLSSDQELYSEGTIIKVHYDTEELLTIAASKKEADVKDINALVTTCGSSAITEIGAAGGYYSNVKDCIYLGGINDGSVGWNSCMFNYFIALKYRADLGVFEVVGKNANEGKGCTTFEGATHILDGFKADTLPEVEVGQFVTLFGVDLDATLTAAGSNEKADVITLNGYAVLVDDIFLPYTKITKVEFDSKYTIEDLPLELAVPMLEGKEFVGWYTDPDFFTERFTELTRENLGVTKIYARFEDAGWVPEVLSNITWELDGGTLESTPAKYVEGEGLTLGTPSKEGFIFKGWLLNDPKTTNFVTEISASQTGDVTVYAIFVEEQTGPVVRQPLVVGPGEEYESLDAALAEAEDDDVIQLKAGSYTLSAACTKAVTIEGPNKGVHGNDQRAEEAIISVVSYQAKFTSVTFDGVELITNTNSEMFFPAGECAEMIFKNCYITEPTGTNNGINKFLRDNNATTPLTLTFENNKIEHVGQFLVWAHTQVTNIDFIGNYVELSNCGYIGTVDLGTALLRIRKGSFNVYDNYFHGELINNPFVIEANGGAGTTGNVRFNTFDGCNKFVDVKSGTVTISDNLYINNSGAFAKDTAPAADEAARKAAYKLFLNADGAILVGEGQTYTTLSAALAAASAGDTIYVLAGTYEEEVTVDKAVTIKGANSGVKGAETRDAEAKFTKAWVIAADGVTLDGLHLADGATVAIGGNQFTMKNCYVTVNQYISLSEGTEINRKASIGNTKAISDLTVEGNYFYYPNAYIKSPLGTGNWTVTNININNNKFESTGASTTNEAVHLYIVAGELHITNNEFKVLTGNFILMTGDYGCSCSVIEVSNNLFASADSNATSGIKLSAIGKAECEVFHNEFNNVSGNVIRGTSGTIQMKYNKFTNGTSFKSADFGGAQAFECADNHYCCAQTTATPDYNAEFTAEDADKAYQAYYDKIHSGAAETYNINYDLAGGKLEDIVFSYVAGTKVELPIPTYEDHVFLGWTIEGVDGYVKAIAKDMSGDVTVKANWRFDGTVVGEGGDYATLADALKEAEAGDIIYVLPGTYSDALVIEVANLTIRGAYNYGGLTGEASAISGKVTVKATGLTIDGMKFTGESHIELAGSDHFTLQYCSADAAIKAVAPGSRYAFIFDSAANSNVVIAHNNFHFADVTTIGTKNFVMLNSEVNGLDIVNNNVYLAGQEFGKDMYNEIIRANNTAGTITIENNVLAFDSDQYSLFLGNNSNTANIYVINNVIGREGGLPNAGLAIRRTAAGNDVVVRHNTFVNCAGNTVNFNSNKAAAIVEVSFNYYKDTAFQVSAPGAAAINYHDNYYGKAQATATADKDTHATLESMEAAYAAYLDAESKKTYSKVEYVLDGGKFATTPKNKYEEGKEFALLTPSKSGYEFLGWSLDPNFGELITKLSAEQTGNVTLYARFVIFAKLTLNLNEGALLGAPEKYITGEPFVLPTPGRTGYKFMGWYDNADFQGDPIATIPATSTQDVELFALWQVEGTFDVTYHLNGANTKYATRQQLVDDFMADYKAQVKGTVTQGGFFDSSYGTDEKTIYAFLEEKLEGKWAWLKAYKDELEAQEIKAPDYASAAAEIRGFLHNFLNATGSCAYGIDFSGYDLANNIWDRVQADEYKVEGATEILVAGYPYHTFLGWFTTPDFQEGTRVTSLTGDCELYGKWEQTKLQLNYVLNNAEATLTSETKEFTALDAFTLETPQFSEKRWFFEGWFWDQAFTKPATEIVKGLEADQTVYAKWTEVEGYPITYVLNGGSLRYKNLDDVLADFLADYNEAMNHNFATVDDVESGSFSLIDFHTFYEKVLDDGTNIAVKWMWLAQYLLDVSSAQLASNNCNVLGLKALVNGTQYTGDATYGLSYAFRGWLKGTTIRPGTSYTSVDFSVYDNRHGLWDYESAAENGVVLNNPYDVETVLKPAYLEDMKFLGWYTTPDFQGEPITVATDKITVYAKYGEAYPVTDIQFSNAPQEMKRFDVLQLEWDILPAEATMRTVTFQSNNTAVVTVTAGGLLEAVAPGKAIITAKSSSSSQKAVQFEVEVYAPDHFEIGYETESYVAVGSEIELNAEYIKRDGSKAQGTWTAENPEIATIEGNKVTGVAEGLAKFTYTVDDATKVEMYVTVLAEELSDAQELVLGAHNSNAFARYNLGIGAGTPAFYRDIIGSVSKILYNDDLVIDRTYEAAQAAQTSNHGGKMSSVEFITVHYTGNMAATSRASNNAEYFSNGGGGTSIHYVTGNDGVFSSLDDTLVGFHAGDDTDVTFTWSATGVKVPAEGDVTPVWGLSADGYYLINGSKTTIKVPAYNSGKDGNVGAGMLKFSEDSTNAERWINKLGLPFKVVGDEYYMGTTWWCYTQIGEGRLCSKGGNLNSIGIESAVNPESDLWYTWQKTAQLVARLMVENNLDITRVVGHHFFSGKDCPQPLLENDCEIWRQFKEMVKYEYELLTTYKDAKFSMKLIAGQDVTTDTMGKLTYNVYDRDFEYKFAPGRVLPTAEAQCVVYEVTIEMGGKTETITLATAVNGIYSEDNSTPCSTYYSGHFVASK